MFSTPSKAFLTDIASLSFNCKNIKDCVVLSKIEPKMIYGFPNYEITFPMFGDNPVLYFFVTLVDNDHVRDGTPIIRPDFRLSLSFSSYSYIQSTPCEASP